MRSLLCVLILLSANRSFAEQERLHQAIDRELTISGDAALVCSDMEFLRRVSLDLIGLPPTADEVRAFIEDSTADKRERIIHTLLDSPQCDRHLTATFDVMLMERRANQHVPQDAWRNWLFQQVRERRPWNKIVSDILRADGDDPASRPAARFFLDRQSEPHLLTRDVGRVFFGRDLQCAQCHDHPLFDDYLQVDYQGLYAFLAPGYPFVRKITKKEGDKETTTDMTIHAEKAGSDLTFESVFFEGAKRRTGPRLPDDMPIAEQFLYPGDEYQVEPAEGVKAVPKISRRSRLADLAVSGSNRIFNENIANRLWAHMLGRGLVHPVDLHHYDNPPTDPELLGLLGERFAAMQFDVRRFLSEIALSQAYQRPFDQPEDLFEVATTVTKLVEEQKQNLATLEQAATAASDVCQTAIDAWDEAQVALVPVAAELDTARKGYDEARKALDTANNALNQKTKELQTKQKALPSVQQAATAATAAVEQFPNDAELKFASDLFTSRTSDLEKSIVELTTVVSKKTAETEKSRAEFAKKKDSVDTLLATLPPLEETLRSSEAALLEERRKMQQQKIALAATERELETLLQIAQLPTLRTAVDTANVACQQCEADRTTAQQQLTDQTNIVTQRQKLLAQLAIPLKEAAKSLSQAQIVHSERAKSVEAVQVAVDAAQAAKNTLPGDVVLADVSTKLSERLIPLQTEMAQSQSMVDAATKAVKKHALIHAEAKQGLKQAVVERGKKEQSAQLANSAVVDSQSALASAQTAVESAVDGLTTRWASDFTLASLKPLTPEQMCWSLLKVTGVYNRQQKAEADKLAVTIPLTVEQEKDPQQVVLRDRQVEQKTYEALKTHVATFVRFYGAAAGQPQDGFFATADQALYVANADTLNAWVAPSGNNVTERIIKAENSSAAADELYLGILNRRPTNEESTEVATLLTEREQQREVVAKELVWGLITSIEFRFNH